MSGVRERILTPTPPAKISHVSKLQRLAAALPGEAEVVALGDSLVAGWPSEHLAAAFPSLRIANLGMPGDRIQNTLWRLATVEVGHLRPSWCLLLLGTNNLGDGDPGDALAEGLEVLITRVQSLWREPRLILASIPWREPRVPNGESERLQLNDILLPELARRYGALLLDSDAALGRGPEMAAIHLDPDRLHLNATGYRRLGRALVDRLATAHASDAAVTPRPSSPAAS